MGLSFKKVDLYGGAITVNVPSEYADVSTIRQVPDHQEVYLSATGFSSLIFDLGERVTHASTDEEALRYHFADIVDEKDTKKILSVDGSGRSVETTQTPSPWASSPSPKVAAATFSHDDLHIPFSQARPDTPVLTLWATTAPPPPEPHQELRPNTATSVTIIMTLIRLVPQSTDMVVTLNIPKMRGEGSDEEKEDEVGDCRSWENGRAAEEGKRIIEEVGKTLQVKDWGLFGEGNEATA